MPDEIQPLSPEELDAEEWTARTARDPFMRRLFATVRDRERQRDKLQRLNDIAVAGMRVANETIFENARKDTERLDWCETNMAVTYPSKREGTLRQTIDAAREKEPK